MAFKMKGSPMARNFGIGKTTPLQTHEEGHTEEKGEKSLMSSVYDKASQIGMGMKNVWDQGPGRSILLGDGSRQTTFHPTKAFKVGYNKEKEIDEGTSSPAKKSKYYKG